MLDGIINIYKEKGYTSHDVVARLRKILGQKKIGHTGTLDPDAQGVLPVCLGKATKLCDLLTDKEKTYRAVLLLGKVTDTQDISGRILKENPDFEYEVEEIPIQGVYSLRESANPTVERIKASQKKPKPAKKTVGLRASLFINVVLMLLIALMFYISMTSTNPTALNYERAVQNKYAEWERELSERESAVREKERELLLEE